MGHPDRIKRLQRWLTRNKHDDEILCMQELKIKSEKAEFNLNLLIPGGTIVLDFDRDQKVGAALVIPPHLQVTRQGTKGDGSLAWATVTTATGDLNIGSIYAPNERNKRKELWEWIAGNLPKSNWVLCGD